MTVEETIKELESLSSEKLEKANRLDNIVNNKLVVDMCDVDLIEATLCRKKANDYIQISEWLKELQRHREAWIVVANAMKECSYKIWHEFGEYVGENCEQLEIINLKTALDILEDYRPKEGENE